MSQPVQVCVQPGQSPNKSGSFEKEMLNAYYPMYKMRR